jgi:hypothetical protein
MLAGYVPFWNLRTALGLGIFAVLLVAASLFLSVRLDLFTLGRRRGRGKRRIFNRTDPVSRLLKLALGGVVLPVAAFVAATRVELPNHQTPMSLAIKMRLTTPALAHAEALGDAVLRATGPAAKVQGILALQGMGSPEALDQLLRILSEDKAALAGGGESQALSKAVASFGVLAKPKLLERIEQSSPQVRREAVAPAGDLFDRYFAAEFQALKNEIDGDGQDPRARAERGERVQVAQGELEEALRRLESEPSSAEAAPAPAQAGPAPAPAASRLPGFVMQTFLAMAVKEDADLLAFARRTAADSTWSDAVRGQALLLVAKLGGKDDLEGLYDYLDSPSAVLQARAAQAIAQLQSRLSGSPEKG